MATDSVTLSPTFNGDTVPLTAGMIVRLKPGANNNVVRARADSALHVQGVNGVVISGASAPGTSCVVVCVGREPVQMESGLTLAVGDTVYVSPNVAGKGTNVLSSNVLAIGIIADISNYVRLGTIEVDTNVASSGTGGESEAGGIVVDTVNTSGTMLTALNAANLTVDNTVAWVTSVGAYFQLQRSALPVDDITVATALGVAGAQWLRMNWRNPVWQAQAAWFVSTGTGSDEAAGGVGTPLKTLSEVARRMAYAEVVTAVAVTITGNMATTDKALFTFAFGTGGALTFNGTSTDLFSGTVTTAANVSAAPTTTENTLTDTSIPSSFTASGLMGPGIVFSRTSGSAAFWYALKDNGSKTIRITQPSNLSTNTAFANGDAYKASQLPLLTKPRFTCEGQTTTGNGITFNGFYLSASSTWLEPMYLFQNCWFFNGVFSPGSSYVNCLLQTNGGAQFCGGNSNARDFATAIQGGGALGTGNVSLSVITCIGWIITAGNTFTMQGCNLIVEQNSFAAHQSDLLIYDVTGGTPPIYVDYGSTFLQYHAGAFGGSGNFALAAAGHGSRLMYTTNPYFVAGSSTDPTTPIQVNGSASTNVAGLPVPSNAQDNGVFLTS